MNFNLRPISFAVALMLAGTTLSAQAQEQRRPYIVQLQDAPAATYTGGTGGLAATQPAPGQRFDYFKVAVQDYVQYLGGKQAAVLATVPNAQVIATYDVVLNGFAVMLTDDQVLALKNNPDVADVQADVARRMDTVSTPRFLGLSAAGGLWSQYAGGSLIKGEDVVIGVIDGGIWPENPAFADRVDSNGKPTFDAAASLAYTSPPATFKGSCMPGEGFDPLTHCNNKLVGAKYFNAGYLAAGKTTNWSEFVSPRDSNIGSNGVSTGHGGHGDHTASTAAGNAGVPVVMGGVLYGDASGIAPRARVAAYKICWTYDDPSNPDLSNSRNGCYNTDAVKAIDEAVKDGVNVINYSISGAKDTVNDVVEQAFYRAALANVFVAASAGNSGPGNEVAHISPWLTTVAASTHDRKFQADAVLGNGAVYNGASATNTAVNAKPLVNSEVSGVGGGNARLCFSNASTAAAAGQVVLDPAQVTGKIVICTRGTNDRVDKSLAVRNAGGIGMILANSTGDLVADAHVVPSVHVSTADGAAIKAYAASTGAAATASISAFYAGTKPAPIMAGFSSRGPNMGDQNVLKPDLTAPGVDIIASVTPALTVAEHAAVAAGTLVPSPAYASYDGTSMSSPHVAGLAMLLHQAHPTWSPAAIKSALMTTAYTTLPDGVAAPATGTLPWAQGAGHVDPNKATNPGLVYDAGRADYVAYQCKVNRPAVSPASDCTANVLDETYNLNLPSITVGNVIGTVTVTRKVTNVSGSAATFTAAASVPGFTTVVSPSTLSLDAGATGTFTVKMTATTAVLNVWQFGALTWTGAGVTVRSPIQARTGKPISAPDELTSDRVSGSKLFGVKTGFTGKLGSIKGGLKEVTMGPVTALVPDSNFDPEPSCRAGVDAPAMKAYPFTVPAGTIVARFALRQQDVSGATDDNDLYVVTPSGALLVSGSGSSNEMVQIPSPAPGVYNVCVAAYTGRTPMSHSLSSWVVTPADVGGKFVVAVPSKSTAGSSTSVVANWSGLEQNKRYLGGVQFTDPSGVVQATTVLRIETGSAAVPLSQSDRDTPKMKQ